MNGRWLRRESLRPDLGHGRLSGPPDARGAPAWRNHDPTRLPQSAVRAHRARPIAGLKQPSLGWMADETLRRRSTALVQGTQARLDPTKQFSTANQRMPRRRVHCSTLGVEGSRARRCVFTSRWGGHRGWRDSSSPRCREVKTPDSGTETAFLAQDAGRTARAAHHRPGGSYRSWTRPSQHDTDVPQANHSGKPMETTPGAVRYSSPLAGEGGSGGKGSGDLSPTPTSPAGGEGARTLDKRMAQRRHRPSKWTGGGLGRDLLPDLERGRLSDPPSGRTPLSSRDRDQRDCPRSGRQWCPPGRQRGGNSLPRDV
jgi:hypothetical protein